MDERNIGNNKEMNKENKKIKKHLILYVFFSIICIVINFIYAQFSHDVSSNYMTYMFLYPLVMGSAISILNYKNYSIITDLSFCGILTITIGSFLQGILEIAGTTSIYIGYFFLGGALLTFIGLVDLSTKLIKG